MNIKVLMQALKFACLPTLSILVLLFFGFFSITETFSFISSNNGWAITLRVAIVIAEGALVWFMYCHYLDIENKRIQKEAMTATKDSLKSNTINSKEMHAWREIKDLFRMSNNISGYKIYETESENIVIVERLIKTEN